MKKIILFIFVAAAHLTGISQNDSLNFFSFKQGFGRGDDAKDNCASVAIIKAAILKYGPGKVFKGTLQNNNLVAELKNGKTLTLTPGEIAEATAKSGFTETALSEANEKTIFSTILYADTLYAVMAEYIQQYGYAGCYGAQVDMRHSADYETALTFITHPGVCTDNIYQYLGLSLTPATGQVARYKSGMSFTNEVGVVLYSDGHAIALYKNFGDRYGEPLEVSDKMHFGFRFKPKYYIILQ